MKMFHRPTTSRVRRAQRRLALLTAAVAAACGVALTGEASAATVLFDFSTGSQGFTTGGNGPAWTYDAGAGQWQVGTSFNTLSTLTSTVVNVTRSGPVSIDQSHQWFFETNWDGGQLQVSVNGGAFTTVNPYTANGYNGASQSNGSPFGSGTPEWTGLQGTLVSSTADLGVLAAGTTLQFMWLAAWDASVQRPSPNWQLDSFSIILPGAAVIVGSTIQNVGGPNTPTDAEFTVAGAGTTGGPADNNTIGTLAFAPGSSLKIFNTLFVTQGPVNLVPSASIQLGGPGGPTGTLSASQLNVAFGATLGGNGAINGNLVNSGLVSPGYSPGTISVQYDYTQTRSGTLRIEIGGRRSGQYDLLEVGGHAYLDGNLELVRLNNFKLRRGDKITFLTAGQGVEGEFSWISNGFESSTILQPEAVYHDKSVALEMVRGSYAAYADHWGLTPNQHAVAETLDSVSADDVNHKALVYLDGRELSKLPGDFERIAPEELSSIFAVSTSGATVQGLNVQRRTDDIRSGSNGFSAAGLAINGQTPSFSGDFRTGAAGPSGNEQRDGKEYKESKEVAAEEKRWGAFLTGTGEWVDVDGDGNARGYDVTTGGFTIGLDYKVTSNFAIGIAAGYAGTSADLVDDGRVWVNGGKLGIYGTFFQSPAAPAPAPTTSKDSSKDSKEVTPYDPGITGSFYADFAVFGGYNSYDTKRSGLEGAARGSTEGGELNVLAGIGYDWKIGALTVGPTATFNYSLVGMDGFTEHGSLAPLDIDRRNAESVRSTFGFRASYDWKVGGTVIKPELRASWQHEYGDKSYDISASFAGGDGDHFLVNGPEIGRDSLLLGAGFAIQLNERVTTYFYYDGELARENYDRHSVSGGVRVAF